MFAKKLSIITCCFAALLNISSYSSSATTTKPLVKFTPLGDCDSPSHTEPMEKVTLEYPKGRVPPQKFQRFAELYIMHPSAFEVFMQSFSSPESISPHLQPIIPHEDHHQMEDEVPSDPAIEQLKNSMVDIIAGDAGMAAIFPQQDEDLEKIDDVKKNQFILLSQWILKVAKPEVAEKLKAKISQLDHSFIHLVSQKWGEGIYGSCDAILSTPLATYEIPTLVLGECNISSILGITPDYFPSGIDREFGKLVSIIKIVSPYIKLEATAYINSLKTRIREAIETKFTSQAIEEYLADSPPERIAAAKEHFSLWIELAEALPV